MLDLMAWIKVPRVEVPHAIITLDDFLESHSMLLWNREFVPTAKQRKNHHLLRKKHE